MASESDGRDESNLSDLPLCLLAGERTESSGVAVYRDRIPHPATGSPVSRTLTVSALDAGRLPSSADEEVLVGLITLAFRKTGFAGRAFGFAAREMMDLLGWKKQTYHYRRLEESLLVWVRVNLSYSNGWFDREKGDFVDAEFHVLDRMTRPHGSLSTYEVVFGDVLAASLAGGNVHEFGFEAYRSLSSPLAKRMYRYLTRQSRTLGLRQVYDLRAFAFDKMGITRRSREGDVGQVKRHLDRAAAQLENSGFLVSSASGERYKKRPDGGWDVTLRVQTPSPSPAPPPSPLVRDLVDFGVGRKVAEELASQNAESHIRIHLSMVQDMIAKRHTFRSSPQAWLVEAIRKNYKGKSLDEGKVQVKKNEEKPAARKVDVERDSFARCEAIWSGLDDEARSQIMASVEAANAEELASLRDAVENSAKPAQKNNARAVVRMALHKMRNSYILRNWEALVASTCSRSRIPEDG